MRRGVVRFGVGLVTIVGLAFAGGFVLFVRDLARTEAMPRRADGIVALTGGSDRIADAVELLAEGRGHRLLITGVNARTSREEIARQNPEFRALFSCCIDLDYRARNTIGNAVETRRWAEERGFRSLVVVTSTWHMPRTLAELGHMLPETRLLPHPVISEQLDLDGWWRTPGTARLLFSEYIKYLVALARIRLEPEPVPLPAKDSAPSGFAARPAGAALAARGP